MPAGAMRSRPQVMFHTIHQVVGSGAVTQLSASFANLEGVVHSYAPHLQMDPTGFEPEMSHIYLAWIHFLCGRRLRLLPTGFTVSRNQSMNQHTSEEINK